MRRKLTACALAACLTMACSPQAPHTCYVQRVVDGDTLICGTGPGTPEGRGRRLRLAGIDALEASQPYGDIATQWLREWVEGRTLTIEIIDQDVYGRDVGYAYMYGDIDIGLALILRGLAIPYMAELDDYEELWLDAKRHGIGLHAVDAFDCPPSQWRQLQCG